MSHPERSETEKDSLFGHIFLRLLFFTKLLQISTSGVQYHRTASTGFELLDDLKFPVEYPLVFRMHTTKALSQSNESVYKLV